MRTRRLMITAAAMAAAALISACGASAGSQASSGSEASSGSGSVTAIEVSLLWPSLDPPRDPSVGLDLAIMNAIYGQLFTMTPTGQVVPELASGYSVSADGLTVTINIRPGVKFQDGTPFTAQAVLENFQRDIDPKNACTCSGEFASVSSMSATGNSVVLHLKAPDPTFIESIVGDAPDWVPSPAALTKEGPQEFGQMPVGAGPFEVSSNVASSKLVLRKFDGYYAAGKPHLASLTFESLPNDQAAYAALESGSAQLIQGLTTPGIIQQAKQQFNVALVPGTQAYEVTFNSSHPPFNNILAREAVAYATDPAQILQSASAGLGVITQSVTGPGGLFNELAVPGFRTYDLAKAKALVQQLHGLSVTLFYGNNSAVNVDGGEALGREWESAGINVKLEPILPSDSVALYKSPWQVTYTVAGGVDPTIGYGGLAVRFGSGGLFSGTADEKLDTMIAQATTEGSQAQRSATFKSIFQYISEQQYAVPLFAQYSAILTAKNVTGLSVSPNEGAGLEIIQWDDLAA
jgi:peptide/nickel transport system substrate-binding protein